MNIHHTFHLPFLLILTIFCPVSGHAQSETPSPAKDPVRVFILAGQSNASGRAAWAKAEVEANSTGEQVRYFYDTDTTGAFRGLHSSGGDFVPLGPASNDIFGPEIGISQRLEELGVNNQVVIKYARGNTNLYSDWNSERADGKQLYVEFLECVRKAIAKLDADGIEYSFDGFFWMQGESDSGASSAYGRHLSALIERVRRDLNAPSLPVVIGRVGDGESAGRQRVRQAQVDTAEADPLATWVNTDDLARFDGTHFDSAATYALGRRMADAWHEMIAGAASTSR